MAKEVNPKLVFERMFGNANVAPQERERRNFLRKSILDLVRDDSDRLNKKLGLVDRHKMDEYTTGVRELEQRIELAGQAAARRPAAATAPVGIPDDFAKHVELMFDLLALAFQTDMTRVATFMFGNEGSNRGYPMVGAKDGHHALSHHRNNKDMIAQIKKIDRYLVGHYAAFLGKLRSIREGEGTLLDNCMVLYGSGIKDGNAHSHNDLPILLAGRAAARSARAPRAAAERDSAQQSLPGHARSRRRRHLAGRRQYRCGPRPRRLAEPVKSKATVRRSAPSRGELSKVPSDTLASNSRKLFFQQGCADSPSLVRAISLRREKIADMMNPL